MYLYETASENAPALREGSLLPGYEKHRNTLF